MGASPSKGGDLGNEKDELHKTLTTLDDGQFYKKLKTLGKGNICSIMQDIMKPYEIIYFIEVMLPENTFNSSSDTVKEMKLKIYITIYSKVIDNFEKIKSRIKDITIYQ